MTRLVRHFALSFLFVQPLLAQSVGDPAPVDHPAGFRTWHLPEGAIARLGKGWSTEGDHAVDFSSNGRYLAVASDIGVWIYEVATDRLAALWPTEAAVLSVSFSPDGATLAAGLRNHGIGLWQVANGNRTGTLQSKGLYFPKAVFSRDGAILASGWNDGTVQLWDMTTLKTVAVLEGHGSDVRALAFSPDGTTLASAGDEVVKLWDVAAGREIESLVGHSEYAMTLAFSPDGTTLASGSLDGTARLWDVATREQTATLKVAKAGVTSVVFSPDGSTLTTGIKNNTVDWDVATLRRVADQNVHNERVYSLKYSPDGNVLVSSAYDGTVLLRDLEKGSTARIDGFHGFQSMTFSPDGRTVAAGTWAGSVYWWNLSAGVDFSADEKYARPVRSLAFDPDGNSLATSCYGYINIRDLMTGVEIATLNEEWLRGVHSIAYSRDGLLLATGGRRDLREQYPLRLWDVRNRSEIASMQGHTGPIETVAFSPDGTTVASGSQDRTVNLWDVATKDKIATLQHWDGVRSMAFSGDGSILITAEYNSSAVTLWKWARGVEVGVLKGHTKEVQAVAVGGPNGDILASGSHDNTIRLWDLAAREEIATFTHAGKVRSLAFSLYEATLASLGLDGAILVWDVSPYITPRTPDPDFDDNGTVDFTDFTRLASKIGLNQIDPGYDARYDLDGDGTIGFGDFLIFAKAFGSDWPQ